MTTTLADLTKPMTVEEASATIYSALAAQGVDVTLWIAGAPTRALIAGLAILLAAFSRVQALIAKSGFLAFSEKAWLTLVALYVYGVERIPGTQAAGTVTLTNGGVGVYVVDVGALIVSKGTKTYRNTASFSLGASASVSVPIAADELGAASSAGATTITNLVTPLPGVTCSNPGALVGLDEESDEALRKRCAAKLGTLSPNGPRDAYDFVSKSAKRADGTPIGVTRTRTIADGAGGIDLYLATGSGEVSNPADVSTIDGELQAKVVPEGIDLRTHSATPLLVAVTYELWISSAISDDDDAVKAKVSAALASWLGSKDIGGDVISPATGKIYKSEIEDVVGNVYPSGPGADGVVRRGTIKRAVTVPAGDVSVATTEAPAAGTITCTAIHRVAGGTT